MKESMKKAAIGFFFKKSRNEKPFVRSQSNQDPVRKEGLGEKQTDSEKHCTVHETIVFSENVAKQYQHEIHVTEERRNFIIDEEFLYDGDGDPEKIYSELKRKSLRQQHIEEEEKKLSDSIKGATQEDQPVQKTPRQMPTKKEEPKKVMSEAYKKIKKFLDTSPSHERLDFTQNMLRMAQQLGRDLTNQGLLPAMHHIAKDNREIKSALIDQFMPLLNFMSEDEQGYKQATETIMPLINDFMYDKIEVVRDKAIKILADFCEILKPDDRGDYILTSVLKLAHENEDENARASALKVLNQLAGLGLLSIELIENFIVMEVSALGGDEYQVVRQAVAENLLNICKNVSPDCFNNKIIPLFRQLSRDQDALVRKACSEQTPKISSVSIESARQSEFTDIYLNFLKDNAKAVRSSSYEHLGPFIATLKGLQIHDTLIESFIKLSENSSKEVQLQCAFNLPGVLWTLGETSWPILRKVYLKLVKLSDARVKRTLAFSIHEIAKIIGERASEEDLLPVLKLYLRDNYKDVRTGALKGLPDFLENISVSSRLPFVDTLSTDDIQKDWRMQVIIANNIETNRIGEDSRKQCLPRFLNMAAGVMVNKDLFETHFIDEFIELGNDKVSNVRIMMAKALKKHFSSNGNFIFDERINLLVDLLKTDKDIDVISNVKDIQTMPQKGRMENTQSDQMITTDSMNTDQDSKTEKKEIVEENDQKIEGNDEAIEINDQKIEENDQKIEENDQKTEENDQKIEENDQKTEENDQKTEENDQKTEENDQKIEGNVETIQENEKIEDEIQQYNVIEQEKSELVQSNEEQTQENEEDHVIELETPTEEQKTEEIQEENTEEKEEKKEIISETVLEEKEATQEQNQAEQVDCEVIEDQKEVIIEDQDQSQKVEDEDHSEVVSNEIQINEDNAEISEQKEAQQKSEEENEINQVEEESQLTEEKKENDAQLVNCDLEEQQNEQTIETTQEQNISENIKDNQEAQPSEQKEESKEDTDQITNPDIRDIEDEPRTDNNNNEAQINIDHEEVHKE